METYTIRKNTMNDNKSTGNNSEAVFKTQIAEITDRGFWPSPEDVRRLTEVLVCIRSPERRQAVLEYALDQAKMDS
jgi:hypothetical protein